jgi:hypothetical protein
MALHSAKMDIMRPEGGADRLSLRRRVQLAADVLAPRYPSRGAASRARLPRRLRDQLRLGPGPPAAQQGSTVIRKMRADQGWTWRPTSMALRARPARPGKL